jgi:hypothetical protein
MESNILENGWNKAMKKAKHDQALRYRHTHILRGIDFCDQQTPSFHREHLRNGGLEVAHGSSNGHSDTKLGDEQLLGRCARPRMEEEVNVARGLDRQRQRHHAIRIECHRPTTQG